MWQQFPLKPACSTRKYRSREMLHAFKLSLALLDLFKNVNKSDFKIFKQIFACEIESTLLEKGWKCRFCSVVFQG